MSQQAYGIWNAAKDAPDTDVEAPERWRGPLSFTEVQARRDAEARAEYAAFFGTDTPGSAA